MSSQNKSVAFPGRSHRIGAIPTHHSTNPCSALAVPCLASPLACQHYAMPLHITSVHLHSFPSPCESTRHSALPFPHNSRRHRTYPQRFNSSASFAFSCRGRSWQFHGISGLFKSFATPRLALPSLLWAYLCLHRSRLCSIALFQRDSCPPEAPPSRIPSAPGLSVAFRYSSRSSRIS